jgi:hypothetical protein
MRSPPPLAIAAVLATACLFAAAAALGGRWSAEGAFWPPLVLLALGGLSALFALRSLRGDHRALADSAGLSDLTPRQLVATHALGLAIRGEHDAASHMGETLPLSDIPHEQALRMHTLCALAYLRGQGVREALDQARRAQRLIRRSGQGSEELGDFYVAWGEVLLGELPASEYAVLEATMQHRDAQVALLARAACVRALNAFERPREAALLHEELLERHAAAVGLLAHVEAGNAISGVRSSVDGYIARAR